MSNGVSALRLVAPESPLAQSPAAHGGIEASVGETIVDAAVLIGGAALVGGGLTHASREAIGDMFVKLFELKMSHPEIDFAVEGKKALRQRLGAELARCGKDETALDAGLAEIVSWPLGILAEVVATEKAWAN